MAKKPKLTGTWLKDEEIKAKKIFQDYLEKYDLETDIDLNLLNQLVYLEMLGERFKKQINDLSERTNNKNQVIVPTQTIRAMHENLNQIIQLKEKLGLLEEKELKDWVIFWKDLLESIDIYINTGENGVICHLKCPHCGMMYLARKDIKDFELLPHPFFIERNIIYNKKLFDLLHEKKLTFEEVAEILDTHSQFIEKLYNKIYLKEKEKEVTNP
jgi:hypothetical protein